MEHIWLLVAREGHEAYSKQYFGTDVLAFDAPPIREMVTFAGYGAFEAFRIDPGHQRNAFRNGGLHVPAHLFLLKETDVEMQTAEVEPQMLSAPPKQTAKRGAKRPVRKQKQMPVANDEQSPKQTALDHLLKLGHDRLTVSELAASAKVSRDAAWKAKKEYHQAYLRQTKTGGTVQ